jgi:hypothetical protein
MTGAVHLNEKALRMFIEKQRRRCEPALLQASSRSIKMQIYSQFLVTQHASFKKITFLFHARRQKDKNRVMG